MAQNYRKLTPNRYYRAIEYSGGLNGYGYVYIVETSMSKNYSRSFGVFGVLQGIKLAKNGPKLPESNPESVLSCYWVLTGCLKTFPMAMNECI